MESTMMLVAFAVLLMHVLVIRLSLCLPCFRRKAKRRVDSIQPIKTAIVFGSGGHTTEMAMLLRSVSVDHYRPIHCILAASDTTSLSRLQGVQLLSDASWHTIHRSREVKQSWVSTVFTSLYSLVEALLLVYYIKPELILCNGPGTCVPVCYAAFFYNLVGLLDCRVVFVESFCRVTQLSATGRLLYYVADEFVVHWPGLARKYPRAVLLDEHDG